MKQQRYMNKQRDSVGEAALMRKWDGLVKRIATRYSFLGEWDDIAQNGRMGLLYAIRYYDESKGVPFVKVAQLLIRTYILTAHRREGNMIRSGKQISCDCDTFADMDEFEGLADDVANDETPAYDGILTDDELDAAVMSRKQYRSTQRTMPYSKARMSAERKIRDFQLEVNFANIH